VGKRVREGIRPPRGRRAQDGARASGRRRAASTLRVASRFGKKLEAMTWPEKCEWRSLVRFGAAACCAERMALPMTSVIPSSGSAKCCWLPLKTALTRELLPASHGLALPSPRLMRPLLLFVGRCPPLGEGGRMNDLPVISVAIFSGKHASTNEM
jgi:hypothetical protein